MDNGLIGREDLPSVLRRSRGRVWLHAIVGRSARGRAPLYLARVSVGPQPDGWAEAIWRYETCTFVSCRTTASRLAAGLEEGELMLNAIRATFEFSPGDVWQWRRDPSFPRLERLRIPLPSAVYDLQLAGLENLRLSDQLVGRNAPSFPTSGSAVDAFFYGNFDPRGTQSPTLGRITLRLIDTGARLRRVRARPGAVDVVVGGHLARGAILELNSPSYRRSVRLTGARTVTWPLPPGAMDDSWLWLKRGANWLDYRAPRNWGGYTAPDDHLVLPPAEDPIAEITALASQGEGQHLEYKSELPPIGAAHSRQAQEAKRTALKDIVAFANGGGGTILYGVTDEGVIIGIEGIASKVRDWLTDLLRSRVFPSLPQRISPRIVDGKLVMMLEITPNSGTLYQLLIDPNKPEYYIRRDGTTYPARADEIMSILS